MCQSWQAAAKYAVVQTLQAAICGRQPGSAQLKLAGHLQSHTMSRQQHTAATAASKAPSAEVASALALWQRSSKASAASSAMLARSCSHCAASAASTSFWLVHPVVSFTSLHMPCISANRASQAPAQLLLGRSACSLQ